MRSSETGLLSLRKVSLTYWPEQVGWRGHDPLRRACRTDWPLGPRFGTLLRECSKVIQTPVVWIVDCVRLCSLWRYVFVLAIAAALAHPVAAEPLPRSVLIFDFTDTNSPWGLAFRRTIRSELSEGSKTPVVLYSEVLELGRFNSPQYQELLRTYLRGKMV